MFNYGTVEEVEKYCVSLAKVRRARRLPLDTLDVGTGLPLSWSYYNFEGEVAVALYDGLEKEPVILTVDFIRSLTRLCEKQGKCAPADILNFYPMDLFASNGNSFQVICAGFLRRHGRDLARIAVGGRSSTFYLDPAFLTEAVDRLDD